jgi:hypothetical protein
MGNGWKATMAPGLSKQGRGRREETPMAREADEPLDHRSPLRLRVTCSGETGVTRNLPVLMCRRRILRAAAHP